MKRNVSKTELSVATIIAIIVVVVLPALNAAGLVSNFTLNLWGKYLCDGLLAISVDLLWGDTGLLTLVIVYAFCRWLTTTKFGLVQRAIRDSETRVLFSGYAAANYKLFVFVVSSLIGAIGGALYVPQVGIINPSEMTPEKSLEAVVWCAVGGRGTIVGPIIGAISVNALKSWATRAFPDLWLIILGVLFILIVLFMPKGIFGLLGQARELLSKRKPAPEPAAAAATVEVKP